MRVNSLKNNKSIAVGIGEILWDRFPEGDCLGGAPANFAFHAAQFGFEAKIVSRVGRDRDGLRIRETLEQLSLTPDLLQEDDDHPTGIVHVQLKSGQPSYTIANPSAWDFLEFNSALEELAAAVNVVCFGSLAQRNIRSGETIRRFLREAHKDSVRLFDLNLRQNHYTLETIVFSLMHSTVLKLNHVELEELGRLFHWKKDTQIHHLFNSYPLQYIAVTHGERGCEIHSPTQTVRADAPSICFRDAVGAGDAFGASLVAGLRDGLPLDQIARNANQAGAFVASQPGATPLFPKNLLGNISCL